MKELMKLKTWNKAVAKWFSENTQAKPNSEITEIIEAKKEEIKRGIITKAEYEEWYLGVVGERQGKTIYKKELTEPSRKYLNSNWNKLYSEDGVPTSEKGKYHKFLINSYLEDQAELPESF